MPEVLALLRAQPEHQGARLIMTDLYPNLDAQKTFNDESKPHLRYWTEPVDAR